MPFNGSGTFSIINTFVPNTTILSSAVNQNLTDIASGLSDCLTRDNQAGMTAVLRAVNGSAGAPAYTFTSDTTTGIYLPGSHQLGISTNGTAAALFDTDQTLKLLATGSMILPKGTSAQQPGSPVAGMFRFNTDNGNPEFYGGSAWEGVLVSLAGAQLPYGGVINGTIVPSNATNAATFTLKTLAGNDPSASDPVLLCFRNSTIGTGNYVFRQITAATSITIPSSATLGASNNVAFKVWHVWFDDGGTIRWGVINTVSGSNIYPLAQVPLASSTTISSSATSAQVFYSGTGVTTKAYIPFGYSSYESGLATAGTWNVNPTRTQLFGAGVPLPGTEIQSIEVSNSTGDTTASATFVVLSHNEVSITPTSAANLIRLGATGTWSNSATSQVNTARFSRGTSANTGLIGSSAQFLTPTNSGSSTFSLAASDLAASTSSVTYAVQGSATGGSTLAFPSVSPSILTAREIMT